MPEVPLLGLNIDTCITTAVPSSILQKEEIPSNTPNTIFRF